MLKTIIRTEYLDSIANKEAITFVLIKDITENEFKIPIRRKQEPK